jgi:small subunit ribosomal protein S6
MRRDNLREYELTVIFRPEDDAYKNGYDTLKKLMEKYGFTSSKDEDMGVRDLAYPIKKIERGHYRYLEISAEPEKVADIDKELKLVQDVLKFLFVRKET